MIRVEKFKKEHLKDFKCSSLVADLDVTMLENSMNPNMDIVSILTEEGEVICFTGVNHLRTGVGEVWIVRSELINEYKFEFYKTVRKLVAFTMEVMGLHRVELAILCTWKGGDKWATSLGFKFESIARAYDFQFNDHAIYTKIEKKEGE